MSCSKASVWGKNQLGIFPNGGLSSNYVENLSPLGILNTLSDVIYLFMHPGGEDEMVKAVSNLVGVQGVTGETQVIHNTKGTKYGSVSIFLELMQEVDTRIKELRANGFKVSPTSYGWIITDSLDNEDGFRLEAATKIEAAHEGNARLMEMAA